MHDCRMCYLLSVYYNSFVFGMAKIRPYLPLCLVIMGCFFVPAGIAIKTIVSFRTYRARYMI